MKLTKEEKTWVAEVIYQYQQAHVLADGKTLYSWVDCSEEYYGSEKAEGGTVRILYTAEQQQKVVGLPELQKWRKPDEVRAQSAYRNIITQLLDEANVKWEVKK